MKTIKSPEEITLLMQNVWLKHKTGVSQHHDNVFFVELPPLTVDEMDENQHLENNISHKDDSPEELFGGWI